MPSSDPKFIFVSFQDENDRLCIEKGAFKNAFLFNALTSNNFLEFTQKTPLNCFTLKAFITFIITKSSSHLILLPENTLHWFKEAVYQTFSKNIAIKCYKNAEKEVNDFKTKQTSLKPNNELNKFIEAVISSDWEQLPKNKPLQSWHINTDTIPPIVFNHFPFEFKQFCIINDKYRFILPDDTFEECKDKLRNIFGKRLKNDMKNNLHPVSRNELSKSGAAQLVANEPYLENSASISNKLCAKLYGLNFLLNNSIQNDENGKQKRISKKNVKEVFK
ncbi:9740_t:CDS:2 [Cetraspora pellucida]|uniref:9740_t:CDS:1 n=1 Tax=Cetraspora pellucida TaxID=1433469 RepID=A0ACA9LFM6_9GLOM|nr:9740_t:CDS:2 [Cetraspora pellucida]